MTNQTVRNYENEPITVKQITDCMNLMLTDLYYNYTPDALPDMLPAAYKENYKRLKQCANSRAIELGYIDSSQLRSITYTGREYVESLLKEGS